MKFDIELVGKIGSMALIDHNYNDIDYNKFARIGRELKPGMIWVSSGATEIGRLDYIKRTGTELTGDYNEIKTDYASQGQAILMQTYRNYINSNYGVRQVLVEHQHFNNEEKRKHLKELLLRSVIQNTIPIINYNDAISYEENRKMEIESIRRLSGSAVELVDNDETAAQVACLLKTRLLIILTSVDGIYSEPSNPETLITGIYGNNDKDLIDAIENAKTKCIGSSRKGANGAAAKLEYIKAPALMGTKVIIANAKYSLKDIMEGKVRCTEIMKK